VDGREKNYTKTLKTTRNNTSALGERGAEGDVIFSFSPRGKERKTVRRVKCMEWE